MRTIRRGFLLFLSKMREKSCLLSHDTMINCKSKSYQVKEKEWLQ